MNANGMTYEEKDTGITLERFEWSNTWHEEAPEGNARRVLYVGDSISLMTRLHMNRIRKEGWAYIDGIHTSKGLDNPTFVDFVSLFAREEGTREAILFNNGLHGWHLSEEEYEKAYEALVLALREAVPAKHFFLILSTRLRNEERTERVKARNEAVKRIGEKLGLPVIDLYEVSDEHFDLLAKDGIHYTDAGYTLFAERVWETINPSLNS